MLKVLDTGAKTLALGYRNEGGTYDVNGMLFINHQSWAHVVANAAKLLGEATDRFLGAQELAALGGKVSPTGVIWP